MIRASTEIGGSNSEFWVRLPGPVFHAAAAVIILITAKALSSARTAASVGAAYITIPAVTFGSNIISTDTILIPFFALALLAFLRRVGPSRQFFPCYEAHDFFHARGTFRDLRPSDLLLAFRDGRLVGTLGGWNRS